MKKYLRFTQLIFLLSSVLLMVLIYGGSSLFVRMFPVPIDDNFEYLTAKKKIIRDYSNAIVPTTLVSEKTGSATVVPILLYHGLLETSDVENLSWDEFWNQMNTLNQLGWQTVGLSQLSDFMTGKPLPEKSFVLTFDDGRRDSYYGADPVLQALGYKAVMFIISGRIKDKGDFHLSKTEIGQMLKSHRWEIGSHTANLHTIVETNPQGDKGYALANKMWLDGLAREETDQEYEEKIYTDLTSAKKELEKLTGYPVESFAFPFGDYGQYRTNYSKSQEIIQHIVSQIYRYVFYQGGPKTGWLNHPGRDVFMLKRIGVEPGLSTEELLSRMQSD